MGRDAAEKSKAAERDPQKPVRLDAEAVDRKFCSTLAARRWCQRHGVPVYKVGRTEWVKPADFDAVILRGVKPENDNQGDEDEMAQAFAQSRSRVDG